MVPQAIKAHKPTDYEGVLIDHIAEILSTRHFENTLIVLMPEANLGYEAHHIERVVMRSKWAPSCCCMRDDAQPGLRTTHAVVSCDAPPRASARAPPLGGYSRRARRKRRCTSSSTTRWATGPSR